MFIWVIGHLNQRHYQYFAVSCRLCSRYLDVHLLVENLLHWQLLLVKEHESYSVVVANTFPNAKTTSITWNQITRLFIRLVILSSTETFCICVQDCLVPLLQSLTLCEKIFLDRDCQQFLPDYHQQCSFPYQNQFFLTKYLIKRFSLLT